MKLTELAIDNFGACRNVRLDRFSNGLNLLFGATGSGKTTLQRYIQNVLFGFSKDHPDCLGHLTFRNGEQLTKLTRNAALNGDLVAVDLCSSSHLPMPFKEYLRQVGPAFFDTIYQFDSYKNCTSINQIIQQLRDRFNVVTGKPTWQEQVEPFSFHNEHSTRSEERNLVLAETRKLVSERSLLLSQCKSKRSIDNTPRIKLESEIDELSNKIGQYDLPALREMIATIDSRVRETRSQLEAAKEETPSAQPVRFIELLSTLYGHLDDLDKQIRDGRQLQTAVQAQRLRLRDEMTVWNNLDFDVPQHPYHQVRQLLDSLQQQLKNAETATHQMLDVSQLTPHGHREQPASQILKCCNAMQDELHQLLAELGRQYQHIRHRSATAELKQLRLQYEEMAENLSRLLNRRQEILTKIQQLDVTGAQAVLHADPAYLRCAAEQGHWIARRRFFGETQPSQDPPSQSEAHCLQSRLTELQNQRKQLVLKLVDCENCLGPLESQLASLREQRTQIDWDSTHSLESQLSQIENRLKQLEDKSHMLAEYALRPRYPDFQPDPLLRRAGQLASQLTLGEVTEIWLHESQDGKHFQLITEGRHQDSIPYQSLNSMAQHQVALSLCLAAVESLNRHGISVPMLLDDVWVELDSARAKATFELLNNFCRQGIQIIAVTSDRSVVSRALGFGIKLHELPELGRSSRQCVASRDQPMSTVMNPTNTLHTDNGAVSNTTVFADLSTPITYPLANYAADKITENNGSETTGTDDSTAIQATSNDGDLPETALPHDGLVLEFAPLVDESTPLINFELFTPSSSSSLQQCGIRDVADLLNQNTENLTPELTNHGFTSEDLETWQSITWLMICVPGLRIEDAHLLRSIGIAEPEQLFTTTSTHLADRLHRVLSTHRENSVHWQPDDYSAERINRWYRALDRTQSRWQSLTGYSRQIRAKGQAKGHAESPPTMNPVGPSSQQIRLATSQTSSQTRKTRRRRSSKAVNPTELTIANSFTKRKEKKIAKSKSTNTKKGCRPLKFHLDLQDHIEAAPSISPKTAERFQNIGVSSIKEFLGSSAESMAKEINYKRISEKTIQTWQNQTQLVCRIPNLRGHDAQILVACGITEPDMLNSMSPDELFKVVKPFSETKQGIKIIRSGKKPDINEVRNWIQWSNQNRTLKAA